MQKIINLMAITAFVSVGTMVAAGGLLYANRDKVIENVQDRVKEQVVSAVAEAIPTPEVPSLGGTEPNLPF